jgi:serine protease Do
LGKTAAFLAVLLAGTLACDLRLRSRSGDDDLPPGAKTAEPAPPATPAPFEGAPANPDGTSLRLTTPPSADAPSRRRDSMSGSAQPASFASIVHVADPSVVTIKTKVDQIEISLFARRRYQAEGLGTGFVVDKNGVILTNNHVVEGAREILVKLSDERELPAQVVGTDPTTDIAVVRIDAKDLQPLQLGDSDSIEVGDWVVAIGNPYGLSHTVSAGIVSAKGRTRKEASLDPGGYYDFLQTDASINPGNSGGPLLNLRGEVVGMNSMIRAGGAQGIGFAIPINVIKRVLPPLLRDGHLTRSALGINIIDVRELSKEERHELGLPDGYKANGAVIAEVLPGGAADRAGLKQGDIIASFDGTRIERQEQLIWLASTAGVGRVVALGVQRGAKAFDVNATLGRLTER